MPSRLTTRSDTPTALTTDLYTTRVVPTHVTARAKLTGNERSKHHAKRTTPRSGKTDGVTMDYQQGFTSGPSV
jgi:hypothetical protein